MTNLIRRNHDNNRQAARTNDPTVMNPYHLMETLLRWKPFADDVGREGFFSPPFEVREAKDAYVIKADLPGIRDSELDVTVAGNAVTVSGRREPDAGNDGDQYYVMERGYGTFSRTFAVSDAADLTNLTADLNGGVLTLRIPKRPEVQPRKINVGSGSAPAKGSA